MSLELALALSVALVCTGVAVSCAEELVGYGVYRSGGLLAWPVARLRDRRLVSGSLATVAAKVYGTRLHQGLLLATALTAGTAAVAAVVGVSPTLPLLATLLGVVVLTSRSYYGMDGARQMTVVVLTGALLASVAPPATAVPRIALGFVAAQLVLSYTVSGVAKLASSQWRSGTAVVGILSTSAYGSPPLHAFLRRHHRVALAVCLGTIVFEAGFVLIVLAATAMPVVLILLGVAFHGSIALAMGLNNFFWAFTAAYPPLVVTLTLLAG